jgi:hypothetical protein
MFKRFKRKATCSGILITRAAHHCDRPKFKAGKFKLNAADEQFAVF